MSERQVVLTNDLWAMPAELAAARSKLEGNLEHKAKVSRKPDF